MEQGWIKLYRKILDTPMIKKPSYLSLWVILLLKANHKDNSFIWNGKNITIKEGQFITGKNELSKQSGIPLSTVWRILKYFEKEQQIEQQITTKFRLITIINWKNYQKTDTTMDNKRTADRQQSDTNKNDKKDEKDIVANDTPFSLKEEIQRLYDDPRRDLNIIGLFFEDRYPKFENRKQYNIALKRHLKPAKDLKEFSDSQILDAIDYAKKEYRDIYTLETLIKILTK